MISNRIMTENQITGTFWNHHGYIAQPRFLLQIDISKCCCTFAFQYKRWFFCLILFIWDVEYFPILFLNLLHNVWLPEVAKCQLKGGAKVLYLMYCMISDLELLTEKYTTNYNWYAIQLMLYSRYHKVHAVRHVHYWTF